MDRRRFAAALLRWYDATARPLPWRQPDTTPWGVLVSEVMLAQTPVSRVEPVWRAWLDRWPSPDRLAADVPGEAVRMWGRLGYPRRALWLHQAAAAIDREHHGRVPADPAVLRRLPGIGGYTAAAVAAFAYGAAVPVLDTNVRRVHARYFDAVPGPAGASPRRGEVDRAAGLLPRRGASRFSAAVMELGALVCRARTPRCERCPVAAGCAWLAAGRPGLGRPAGRSQPYAGTDRQARGRLLAALRNHAGPVGAARLDACWPDRAQRERALAGLVADGLVEPAGAGYRLPR